MSARRLSGDERELWFGVTRSVSPLARRTRATVADEEPVAATAKQKPRSATRPGATPVKTVAPAVSRPEPKPLAAPLGRKERRRIARGQGSIDARLDLHGMTQAEAHDRLLGFLRKARGRNARVVLVITGKGAGAAEGRGVLKRQVPMWLRLPEFAEFVVGFESAAISHGGEGAMYVRIRRARTLQSGSAE